MSQQPNSDPPTIPLLGKQPGGLGGENVRGQTAECPTGLADPEQAVITQPGGGPGTGAFDPSVLPSPGEGVTEEEVEQSALDAE